jgi:hypothetical protein
MSARSFSLNVVLGAIAVGLVTYIAWEMLRPGSTGDPPSRPRPSATAPVATAPPRPAPEPLSSWAVIASRNPFSPSRSEAPVTAAQVGAAANVPRPFVYGIVLKDGAPFAYIEDPVTKRVAAYRIGDAVAGGTVQKIARDGIVLARPEGVVDVRLHDPSKPRPAAPATAPAGGATPGPSPATPPLPGVIPPAQPRQPTAEAPAVQPTQPPRVPFRRPLPPNLLRRLPQPPPSDDQSR